MSVHPEEKLSAYIDNELQGRERLEVEAHIESCTSCQTLLKDLLSLQSAVALTFHAISEPDGLENRVIQSLGKVTAQVKTAKGWLFIPLAVFFVLGMLWLIIGAMFVKLIGGLLKFIIALVYMISHLIAGMPVLSGMTIILSFIILGASAFSLRRLLLSTTS